MRKRKSVKQSVETRSGVVRRLFLPASAVGVALLAIAVGLRAQHSPSSSGSLPPNAASMAGSQPSGATGAPRAESDSPEELRLRAAVARRPEDALAHEQLGAYYLAAERPFEALWEFEEALALAPDDFAARLGLASALEAGRLTDQAVGTLRGLLAQHPGEPQVSRRLADLSLATGQTADAVAVLRAAKALHQSPEDLLALGRAYQSLNRLVDAERVLKQAQGLLPDRPEPLTALANLYLDRGDTPRAEQAFLAARRLTPRRAEPGYGLGRTYLRRGRPGDPARAEQEFRAALRLDPRYAPARRELGQLFLASKQYRQAGEEFFQAFRATRDVESCRGLAQALAAVGHRVESQYHWGLYYTRKDLRPRSAAAFQAMAALDPQRTEATLLLSETYFRMKQEERGVKLVEAALQRHPRDVALYERLAGLYSATGNRPAATRTSHAWLRAQPDAVAPHWVLGKIAIDTLRFEEGLRELELAVSREPGNAEFAYALAGALLRRPTPENRTRAAGLLVEAVRLAPGVARYRNQLGLTLRAQSDAEGARQQFLRSLDLDPHEAPVYSNLVAIGRQLGKPHQVRFWAPLVRAVEDRTREEMRLWRAVWDRPTDAGACYQLALFLTRTGDLSKAQSQLEEALRLRPQWPEARQTLVTVSNIVRVRSG